MAGTRKTVTEDVAEEIKEVVQNEEEKVTIKIPLTREDNEPVFVAVNNRTWLIKRGTPVTVPKCVYEVLQHQEEMQRVAIEFINSKVSFTG